MYETDPADQNDLRDRLLFIQKKYSFIGFLHTIISET